MLKQFRYTGVLITGTFFLLGGCGLFQEPGFQVADATQRKYIGGRPNAGSSIHYTFKLVPEDGNHFEIEKVWVNNTPYQARRLRTNKDMGDTVVVKIIRHVPSGNRNHGEPRSEPEKKTAPPKKIKGKALIQYQIEGEQKFCQVKEVRMLKPVPLP